MKLLPTGQGKTSYNLKMHHRKYMKNQRMMLFQNLQDEIQKLITNRAAFYLIFYPLNKTLSTSLIQTQ